MSDTCCIYEGGNLNQGIFMFLKSVFFVSATVLSINSFAGVKSVYDMCSGELENWNGAKSGSVETQIAKNQIVLKVTGPQGVKQTANFKILKTSNNVNGRDVSIFGEFISGNLPTTEKLGFIQFTADSSMYYGDPQGSISLKAKTAGIYGNSFAGAVMMSCKTVKSEGQILNSDK